MPISSPTASISAAASPPSVFEYDSTSGVIATTAVTPGPPGGLRVRASHQTGVPSATGLPSSSVTRTRNSNVRQMPSGSAATTSIPDAGPTTRKPALADAPPALILSV